MKKLLLGIAVVVVLSMLGTAALAGSSAPKSLCFQWQSVVFQTMMTLKALGTIKTADGPVKQYAVHGTELHPGLHQPSTFTGTAIFTNGVLSFNYVTIVRHDGTPGTIPSQYWQMWTEGSLNTATGTGMVSGTPFVIPTGGGTATVEGVSNFNITVIACEDLSISAAAAQTNQSTSDLTIFGFDPK